MGYFFYNLEGIGNVLLVKNCFDKEVTSTKDFDGVTALYNNDEVIGYNVFDLEGLDLSSYQGRIMPVPTSLLEKVNAVISLIVPLFISAFSRAEELANAMEARCYNPEGKRTRYKQLYWNMKDTLVLGVCLVMLVVIIILSRVSLW